MAAIKQFLGLFTNADPGDIPRGASQRQDNLLSRKQGCLQVRYGFGSHKEDGSAAITQIYPYSYAGSQYAMLVNASGEIRSVAL
jgi:hypothetical protein